MPNLKFLAATVPEIWRGPNISKVGHVTPSRPPLTYFCILFVSAPGNLYACQIGSLLLQSFPRYGGGPKISKVGHVTPYDPC